MDDDQHDILVCSKPNSYLMGLFPDNEYAVCRDCNEPIIHRPHADPSMIKLCAACATARAKGSGAQPAVSTEGYAELCKVHGKALVDKRLKEFNVVIVDPKTGETQEIK